MKYPALLSVGQALSNLDGFDAIIDVRSESEFALDHIPGAINCPVLHDEERVTVGTLYKQDSPFKAKKIGAAIVARNIAAHLDTHFVDHPKSWQPLVYCWRGGNRSGAMAHILAKIGWPSAQLDGGYKAYRRCLVSQLDEMAGRYRFQVICGTTGSGKSRLLETLALRGAQVLDLEKLAAHRGSLLGSLPGESQPTQKMFESRIWHALRQCSAHRVIFVESESKKIGDLRVPEQLMESIRTSPCLRMEISTAHRVALLIEDYPHLVTNTSLLMSQLAHLVPLHGRDKIAHWRAIAESGDSRLLVEVLLKEHYDPAYLKSIARNFAGYRDALTINLPDVSTATFQSAAAELMQAVDAQAE